MTSHEDLMCTHTSYMLHTELTNLHVLLFLIEDIVESPLDSKEIQPVYPKGNQS